MHSIDSPSAHFRSNASAVRAFGLGALLLLGSLGLASSARAQAFVAEWGMDDIGRIGPTGMALDTVGTATYLYVADQPLGRILKIDLGTGARVAAWGQTGNGPLEFNSPYGVAVDPTSHDLYIAERGNHRIQRITNTGKFVMGWGELGTAPGQFDSPIGVAADASGNVYVVDHMNSRVEKFHVQQSGTSWNVQFVTAWGGYGAAPGQFNMPYGITLDSKGVLWVADARNHRLQKFDTNGNFIGTVGSFGTGDGQFVTPTWVNFDSTGAYYVSETNSDPQNLSAPDLQNQRIQKFSASEAFVMKWGSYGEVGGQFKLPFDVVVDKNGYAYVSDYYNTRLQKFSLNAPPGGGGGGDGAGTQFSNVSSRLRTNGDGAHTLIAGVVIRGSSPKQVLIRGIGPTLAQYGVTGVLPNPKLQVYAGSTLIAENEDWAGSPAVSAAATKVGAFDLPPTSKDAAVVLTLQPGLYSTQVVANGGDGVAMVEVYDADTTVDSKLINLSTRGFADTGDGVLVAGFVIKGTTPKRVLVRGIGPTLAAYGVAGPLADPTLKLYSGSTVVAQNDNWETPQTVAGGGTAATATEISNAATACGAFSLTAGGKDSSVLVTLQPGLYSAIVAGAGNTTGPAMVEVYEVPSP